jgi:hypothetical protein
MTGHPGRSGWDMHVFYPLVMNAILFTSGSTFFACRLLDGGKG